MFNMYRHWTSKIVLHGVILILCHKHAYDNLREWKYEVRVFNYHTITVYVETLICGDLPQCEGFNVVSRPLGKARREEESLRSTRAKPCWRSPLIGGPNDRL